MPSRKTSHQPELFILIQKKAKKIKESKESEARKQQEKK